MRCVQSYFVQGSNSQWFHSGLQTRNVNSNNEDNLVAGIEEDPIAQALPERTTFIPIRHTDLRSKLVEHFGLVGNDRLNFRRLCRQLQAIFHMEHLSVLIQLEELYCHLDPDTELLDLQSVTDADRDRMSDQLMDRVSSLLFSAHYKRLSQKELERAIEIGWQWGVRLDVDFERFHRLEIFARGYRTVETHRRRWKNFFRKETIELPEFQRLILVFRTNRIPEAEKKQMGEDALDSRHVYLKTFKNIPETDLEILLPGSRVRLTRFDHAKILFPTISGTLIIIYKLVRSALVLVVAFTIKAIIGWIIFIGVTIGYVIKSVLSYFRTKTKYQFGLTRSLYLKNLDNNQSVIYRIVNEAEEQELCESILAYAILWRHDEGQRSGLTGARLDELAESFIRQTTGMDVDFEIHDALGKLARLGLADINPDGAWKATPIQSAFERLNRAWEKMLLVKRDMPQMGAIEQPDDARSPEDASQQTGTD